jgi:hypothetical protein
LISFSRKSVSLQSFSPRNARAPLPPRICYRTNIHIIYVIYIIYMNKHVIYTYIYLLVYGAEVFGNKLLVLVVLGAVERDERRVVGGVEEVKVDELVEARLLAVAVVERVGEGVPEERRDHHAGRRVPVPVGQREGVVADELPEGFLVEVDVHAVPRREDPGEVHVEGAVLLRRVVPVVPVAVGLVDRRLRREAQRVRRRQRLHLGDGLLVLLLVLPAQEVRRLPDAPHRALGLEVDGPDRRRRRARVLPVGVRALHQLVVYLVAPAAALHGVRLQGAGREARVPDEAGGDAAQAGEHVPAGQPEETVVVAPAGGPAPHSAAGAGGLLGRACRGLGRGGGSRRRDGGARPGAGVRHGAVHGCVRA